MVANLKVRTMVLNIVDLVVFLKIASKTWHNYEQKENTRKIHTGGFFFNLVVRYKSCGFSKCIVIIFSAVFTNLIQSFFFNTCIKFGKQKVMS